MIKPGREDEGYIDWLADESEISKRRAEAEERFADLSNDQLKHLRKRCKTDLFFLASGPLEYELLSVHLHGHYCQWLQKTRGERYRLSLLPRGHYKTTVSTISESVQIALPNDDEVVTDYPWNLGTDVKIMIGHETERGASRALLEIQEAFLSKPWMLALFPECIPTRKKQRINKTELELPRRRGWKEPTFDVIGAGGAAQGRHYHRLKLDDLIGEAARESPTVMQTVLDWFDNANSLFTRQKLDGFDLTGTRWAMFDVYSHAMERYGIKFVESILRAIDRNRERLPEGVLAAYIRGAIEEGVPIFPEEVTLEDLAIIQKNRKVWAAQYANNPLDDDMTEFGDWLKFYNIAHNGDIVIFTGKGGSERIRPHRLDRCILCDPSMGETESADETGIVVTGVDNKGRIFVLETIKKRLRPPEFIDALFKLYAKWWPRSIAIEKVNFSGIYQYWFQRECARLGIYPNVISYQTNNRKKEARVRGLGPYAAAGQLYCLEGMHELREEFERFGVIKDYHLLDALAQGPEVWQDGPSERDLKELVVAEQKVLDRRSAETGY